MQANVYEKDLWVSKGDHVEAFSGANQTIGTLIMKFDSQTQMERALQDLSWIKINVI